MPHTAEMIRGQDLMVYLNPFTITLNRFAAGSFVLMVTRSWY